MKKTVLLTSLVLFASNASADLFDDFSTIVGGHIEDIQSRFMDDQIVEGEEIARSVFREKDRGQDALHHGSGSVSVIETSKERFLQLASDFSSTPGPDYHVYISQDTGVDHEDSFVRKNQIELGRLIKGSGASFYKIPDNTEFRSVTIWCKAFGEFIMSADFSPASEIKVLLHDLN